MSSRLQQIPLITQVWSVRALERYNFQSQNQLTKVWNWRICVCVPVCTYIWSCSTSNVNSASQVALVVKNPPANAGDMGSIPGSGRSFAGGNGNALQDCCLGNLMDREAQRATVQDVTTNRTQLSYWTVAYYSERNLIWEHFHPPKMIASVHCRHSIFLTSISLSQLMTSVDLPFWCVSYNYIHRIFLSVLLWAVAGSVAKSCPTLCNTMDCSPPDSSVHGIPQERILERAAISCCRASSQCRDRSCTS